MIRSSSTYILRKVHGRTNNHIPATKSVHLTRRWEMPRKKTMTKKKKGKYKVVPRTKVASPRIRPATKDHPIEARSDKLAANIATLNTSKVVNKVSAVTHVAMTTAGGKMS